MEEEEPIEEEVVEEGVDGGLAHRGEALLRGLGGKTALTRSSPSLSSSLLQPSLTSSSLRKTCTMNGETHRRHLFVIRIAEQLLEEGRRLADVEPRIDDTGEEEPREKNHQGHH